YAEHLRESCERFDLPYVLHEIPTIHRSIHIRGSSDLRYTKPNFIQHLLDRYRVPILYLDVDCVFRAYPTLIDELIDGGISFAIYNWLADVDNETFWPINVRLDGRVIQDRFYHYSHRVPWYSTEQLICSGCVQFYDVSTAASALLAMWHRTIEKYPGTPDDQCLWFAFNNGGARIPAIRWSWLPKDYARYAWWIFSRPVIEHPDLPGVTNSGFENIPVDAVVKDYYEELCRQTDPRFPENSVIDVEHRQLYEFSDGCLSHVGPLELELWIQTRNRASATLDISEIRGDPDAVLRRSA
ncbi:MAG: hypothetical protein OEW21_07235, partial [Betaproteobacteria bacterium]|nr:hypothetical protein [Betaproteobacteria bacterium]